MRLTWSTSDKIGFCVATMLAGMGVLLFLRGKIGDALLATGMAAIHAGGTVQLRHAFNHGWLSGRLAMISAIGEAGRRGMTLEECLERECARDRFGVARVLRLREPLAPSDADE